MSRRVLQLITAGILVILLVNTAAAQSFSVNASVGLLYDFNSGQILFSQQGETQWIPASLVKVMTMYVALDRITAENIPLDSIVTVSENAWRMGGSQMFLEVGDQVKIEDLLFGIATVSGNDACVAIAEALAGTEDLFVQWMNDKARSLGLNLHFVDVHGLSDANQITALDFALLVSHYLHDHPQALRYHSQRSFSYKPRSSANPIVQSNRNGLLKSYEGADGLKTGYLSKAGYNLVATAERDGRRLIAVVLGADSETRREQEATKILDYGFRSFELVKTEQLLDVSQARVYKGRAKNVSLTTGDASVTVLRGKQAQLQVETQIDSLEAPIKAGDQVGKMKVYLGEELLKEVSIVAENTVERGSWFTVLIDSIVLFFKSLFKQG